ncbi:beta-lactamase/transpeptidase-like protein [Trichoderma barbatum]
MASAPAPSDSEAEALLPPEVLWDRLLGRGLTKKNPSNLREDLPYDNCEKKIRGFLKEYEEKADAKFLTTIKPVVEGLLAFSQGISNLTKADKVLPVVWGSTQILLESVKSTYDVSSNIKTLLEGLAVMVPRSKEYLTLFPGNERLRDTFRDMCAIYVEACIRTALYLERRAWNHEIAQDAYRAGAITKSSDEIVENLNKARGEVADIVESNHIVGLSCHVIFQGKTVWTENRGHRNDESLVTSDTIFPIGALSQGFTAACVAQQVYRRKLSYDNKVSALVPGIKNQDVTVGDLLGHRTGFQAPNHLLQMKRGGFFECPMSIEKFITETFNNLGPQASLRSRFLHNSIGYALLGQIVSTKYGDYLEKNVLKPLQMGSTRLVLREEYGAATDRYSVGVKGELHVHKRVEMNVSKDDPMPSVAVGGMSSTANDLAKYCIALNEAWKRRGPAEDEEAQELRCNEVFPDVDLLFNPLQPMGDVAPGKGANKSHAAGWATCTLPAAIGDIGINPELIDMPILGVGSAPVTIIWNQSKYHSTNCFVALLPEYEAAAIVLSNTVTGNDATDWIGQLLIQTLLDNPWRNNYPFLASVSALNARQKYFEVAEKIKQDGQPGGCKRALDQYRGLYESPVSSTSIFIYKRSFTSRYLSPTPRDEYGEKVKKSDLTIGFWGSTFGPFPLHHHHGDSFTWIMPWDEMVKAQFRINYHAEYYLIRFEPSKDGKGVDSLRWINDPAKPEGELFTRYIPKRSY